MKTLQLFLLVLLLSCGTTKTQEEKYEFSAQILGKDKAQCACCGNWKIKIEGENEIKQFVALPPESDIDLNTTTFPLDVQLNWSTGTSPCYFITIESIRRSKP